jgi:beta-lactamase class D
VLTSLRKDEMTPSEKAVQSRIKEAFAFKIPNSLWEFILDALESTDPKSSLKVKSKGKANNYNSDYYTTSKEQKSAQDYYKSIFVSVDKKNEETPLFKIKGIEEDPSLGQMTQAIYFGDQDEWLGVD